MAVLKNRAKMSTSTTGTGTITLGSAESGYQSFADAGVANADVVRYVIEDGNNFEIGTGTYTSSGTTLTRTVSESSNSNNTINLSGSATVFIGATAEDILSDVVDDTTPQLGGNLDVQAREITTSTTNGNVKLTPNGTGVVEVKGAGGNDGTLQLNCSANSHGVKIKSPPHSAAASYTLTLPDDDGAASEFLQTDGSGNLSWAAGGSIGGNTGVDFNDNVKARFGNSNDLEIYHSGSASIINDVGNGPLHIKGSTSVDFFGSNGEYMAYMVENGAVGLYHDGSQKLNTTSSGIQTTGTVNVNNAYTLPTADGSANQVLTTNGSGVVNFADAGGGGDPDLYRDNASSATTPSATGSNAVAVGNNSVASGTDSLALGAYANATGFRGIAVGRNVYATSTGSNAFGVNAYSAEQDTIALGNSRAFGGAHAFASAIGNNTTTYGAGQAYALALGFVAKAHNANSIAIGRSATVTHDDSVALGRNAASSAANQITLGSSSDSVRISSAFTLPTAAGSANQVLTTAGDGTTSWAAASGGGGADLYAENYTTGTKPATTGTNAVAIGKGSSAAGTEAIAMVDGTADSQDSFAVGGIVQSAIGGYAIGKSAQVYSQYGLALGKSSLVTAATDGTAVGVSSVAGANSAVAFAKSRAAGADSLAGAIANNTSSYGASGSGAVALMNYAKATGSSSGAFGFGANATNWGAHALGAQTFATGDSSVSLGRNSLASATYSICIGNAGQNNIQSSIKFSGSQHANQGDAQIGLYPLMADTTDATATAMVTNHQSTPSAGTANQIVLPNNSVYAFHGTIVARQKAGDGTACAAWKIEGLIRREANAGTTVLVNSATTVLDNTPSWGMALSADTTNGCLKIQVTGAASTNIRWTTSITTSELIYA